MATESTSQLGRIEGYVIDVGAGGAATRRRTETDPGRGGRPQPRRQCPDQYPPVRIQAGHRPVPTVLTDANGYYFIDLPEGRYDLVCAAFSPTDQTRTVGVTAGTGCEPPRVQGPSGIAAHLSSAKPGQANEGPERSGDRGYAGHPFGRIREARPEAGHPFMEI